MRPSSDHPLTGVVRWASRQVWSANPLLLLGFVAVALVGGLAPAALAVTARGLINAVVHAFNHGINDLSGVLPWLVLGMGLTVAQAVSQFGFTFLSQRLQDELNLKLTSDILSHAADLEVSFFEDVRFQDLMERTQENAAGHLSQFVTHTVNATASSLQVLSLAVVLITIEPLLTLVLVLVALPYLLVEWRLAKARYVKEHSRTTKRRWIRYFISRLTSQPSVAEVKLLDLAPVLAGQFRSIMMGFRDEDRKLSVRQFVSNSFFAVVATVVFYAMFIRVAMRVLQGSLSVGDIAIYGGATLSVRRALESAIRSIAGALEQTLFIGNLQEFLSLRSSMPTSSGPMPSSARGELEFRGVSFTYPGSSQAALSNLSLHIKPGEIVALVGENGAGKTTLVKLIGRLYDPDEGAVFLDGHDLRKLPPSFIRSHIAFLLQRFGRYEATAADNVAFGDWRRLLHDREQVKDVSRRARIDAMIEAMPQGYDTSLGRLFGSYDSSEGQWQQIALARAFARNAPVLVLDEPLSHLDARAEYALFCSLRELAHGKTTIFVSHRFSSVSLADRIVVLERGQVVESGPHEELLARKGYYASLYHLQRAQLPSRVPEEAPQVARMGG
jgi:ATP-binding cassette, subfamily B, bacterial